MRIKEDKSEINTYSALSKNISVLNTIAAVNVSIRYENSKRDTTVIMYWLHGEGFKLQCLLFIRLQSF